MEPTVDINNRWEHSALTQPHHAGDQTGDDHGHGHAHHHLDVKNTSGSHLLHRFNIDHPILQFETVECGNGSMLCEISGGRHN